MGEARHDVLDSGELHLDVGRTGVPIFFAGEETFFWFGGQRKTVVLIAGYIVV
jgi:hypothetical protein